MQTEIIEPKECQPNFLLREENAENLARLIWMEWRNGRLNPSNPRNSNEMPTYEYFLGEITKYNNRETRDELYDTMEDWICSLNNPYLNIILDLIP